MKLWMLVVLLLWPCSVSAALCTLIWQANPENDLAGYWLYHGLQSGVYGPKLGPIGVSLTPTTTCDAWGILSDNQTHFFAVSAFLPSGQESALSNEVSTYLSGNVTPIDTSTTITSITGSNLTDQPYTVLYAVSPGGTGTVTVTDGTGASCSSVAPTGSCSLISTTAGTKTITAAYGGDSIYNASQGTTTYVVSTNMTMIDTSTTITSITGSNLTDQPYTVLYAVSPGGTGTVTVTDGTGASCSSVAPTGSCSLISTTAGTKTITAAYGGDSIYNASQGTTTYVVSTNVTVPNAPSSVNAILSSSRVSKKTVYSATISWEDNSSKESGFKLQRFKKNSRDCVLETTFTVTVGANVTSYTDSTASANTCGYGVASYDSVGTSQFVTDFNLLQ